MFGGSTVEGIGVMKHQTIPSYIQEILEAKGYKNIGAYNFGWSGATSLGGKLLLGRLLFPGKFWEIEPLAHKTPRIPDIAIFIDGLNDFVHIQSEKPQLEISKIKFPKTNIKRLLEIIFGLTASKKEIEAASKNLQESLKTG